jgi:hypothetical protein
VRGRLIRMISERAPLYEEVAGTRIDTDKTTPAEVVDLLVRSWPSQE